MNNKLNYILLSCLFFLCSCGEQEEAETGYAGNAVEVTQDLQVQVLPICPLGISASRAATEPQRGEALQVSYLPDETTRSDKTPAEKEIKTAYVVQFNGTAATSTATWVSGDVATQLKTGSPINCNFSLSSSTQSRVYVVANPKTTPTKGMTLQAFEVVSYTVSSSLPGTGLPMAAYQDVLSTDKFSLFQLKSPLAKLKFTVGSGTLTLNGVPSAYSFASTMLTPGTGTVRPSGVTYTATASLTSGTAYYVPANLSGQVSGLSSSIHRYAGKAPANSMYVDIETGDAVYSVYLGDGTLSDFNVASNYSYTVSTTFLGTHPSDLRVELKNLSAYGTANCYIVTKAGGSYSFDATVMGNGKKTPAHTKGSVSGDIDSPAIVPATLAPAGVEVLWETLNTTKAPTAGAIVSDVKLDGGRVTFRSGSAQGNAVIAVKNAGGTILWSWHIWRVNAVNEFPLAAIGSVTTDGELVLMDRNLGALSATAQDDLSIGLHYQWGRKDPFPAYAGFASPNDVVIATTPSGIPVIPGSSGTYTIAQSITQPTTFYRMASSPYDWCSARTDNLWGTPLTDAVTINNGEQDYAYYNSNKGSKSIYDPCPPAWRVPPGYVFANVSLSKVSDTFRRGYSFSIGQSGAASWFPASGGRGDSGGALGYIGSSGNYWISAPLVNNPTLGSKLYFTNSSVFPDNGYRRMYGHSCRCCKE